jgi:hypothetical protein
MILFHTFAAHCIRKSCLGIYEYVLTFHILERAIIIALTFLSQLLYCTIYNFDLHQQIEN